MWYILRGQCSSFCIQTHAMYVPGKCLYGPNSRVIIIFKCPWVLTWDTTVIHVHHAPFLIDHTCDGTRFPILIIIPTKYRDDHCMHGSPSLAICFFASTKNGKIRELLVSLATMRIERCIYTLAYACMITYTYPSYFDGEQKLKD